jgi:large subunit ribosomal protein L15
MPKRGFRSVLADKVVNVNVSQLEVFDAGSEVTIETLKARGLIKGRFDSVKILGGGELNKKLTVKVHGFSASAAAKIEKAGGKAEVVSRTAAAASSDPAE